MGKTQAEVRIAIERVGLVGDVHTERARLSAVLDLFAKEHVDRVLCTGDIPDGPGDASAVDACCALLRAASVITVAGNHDRWLLDREMRDLPDATLTEDVAPSTLAYLRSLPPTVELDTPGGLVLLCHGLGADDMAQVRPFDHGRALEDNAALQELLASGRYRYVLNGHSHKPMVRTLDGLTLINAGTLLAEHGTCCALLDFARREARFHGVEDDGSISVPDVKPI